MHNATTTTIDTTAPITMTCICGTDHTFAPGEGTGECAGCGLGLVLTEEVTIEAETDHDDRDEDGDGSEDEDDDDRECRTCHGSGIGRTGDPDTSRCSDCGGSGVHRPYEDDEPADIDDDRFTDPYAGGPEDYGFDIGGDDY
jgi:DnaJ-class molecular chaperone